MRILLIALEFHTWRAARSLTYCAQLAFEEGLASQDVDCFTITTPWLISIRQILRVRKFDQVWVELVHSNLDEELLSWISQLAPVRVGFILESLEYTPDEHAVLPLLKERKNIVERKFKYMTHVVACDEHDVDDFNARRLIPSLWWPQAVPGRFIDTTIFIKPQNFATFSGALYGNRTDWLAHEQLKNLLVRQQSSEQGTIYPMLFNMLHGTVFISSKTRLLANEKLLDRYLDALRYIRRNSFLLWLKGMQKGCAVVNLPHFVKTYAGRVVEGMAAGRPVISWEIPNRPRNKALFEPEKEILLFDKNNPAELASQIRKLSSEQNLYKKIIYNATQKLKRFHTIEKRVEEILQWIEKGSTPTYG